MQIHGKIQFVNQPEGNRPGSIKIDGRYVSVPTQLLPQFQRGSQIVVEVREKEVNGRIYYNLVNVISNGNVPQSGTGSARANGYGGNTAPTPNFVGSVAPPSSTTTHSNSGSKEIFVTSFVKESTRIGKCVAGNVDEYIVAAKRAWEKGMEGFSAPAIPYPTAQPRFQPGDLNDDIDDIGRDPHHPPF